MGGEVIQRIETLATLRYFGVVHIGAQQDDAFGAGPCDQVEQPFALEREIAPLLHALGIVDDLL